MLDGSGIVKRSMLPASLLLLALLSPLDPLIAQGPSSLSITPSSRFLEVGERATLTVVDASGRPVRNARWTLDDPVAVLQPANSQVLLEAQRAGKAVLTANVNGAVATASITVVGSSSSSPLASIPWFLDPNPGYETLLSVNAFAAGTGVDFYSIEWNQTAGAIIRALRETGEQLWMVRLEAMVSPQMLRQEGAPPDGQTYLAGKPADGVGQMLLGAGRVFIVRPQDKIPFGRPPEGKTYLNHATGDGFGGILLLERANSSDSLVSLRAEDGTARWRYHSPGRLNWSWTINRQGDIGVVETVSRPPASFLLIVNGETGEVRRRISFPTSSSTVRGFKCQSGNDLSNVRPSRAGGVIASADGSIYVQVEVHKEVENARCAGLVESYTFDNSLSFLRVMPSGQEEWVTFAQIHADGVGPFVVQARVFAGETIPDGGGGVLLAWTYVDPGEKGLRKDSQEARLTHVTAREQRDFTLPMDRWAVAPNSTFHGNLVLSDADTVYVTNHHVLLNVHIPTGDVKWGRRPPKGELSILWTAPGGGIVIANEGRWFYVDSEGDGGGLPWTVAPHNPKDIGLAQRDPFDQTELPALQLRDLQYFLPGVLLGVEEGAPYARGRLLQATLPR